MRIISWNIAGIKKRKLEIEELVQKYQPDILCMQKTRSKDAPLIDGYNCLCDCADQWSGVATYCRNGVDYSFRESDSHHLILEFDSFVLINAYVPYSNKSVPGFIERRKKWDKWIVDFVTNQEKPVVMCGDLNIVHTDLDSFYPSCVRNTGCYYPWERENFNRLLSEVKLVDTFRTLLPDERKYTYFDTMHGVDYRATNQGSRLDYFLVSESLMSNVVTSEILPPLSAPSNPIMLDIKLTQDAVIIDKDYDELVRSIPDGYQYIMQMAIREYTPLVKDICQRTASSNEVEHLLDYMFDFVGNNEMLLLYKQICRCYFDKYPEMIAWHIMEYRKVYDRESLIGTKYEYLLHEDDEMAEDI